MVHTFKPSTSEAEQVGSLWVPERLGICGESHFPTKRRTQELEDKEECHEIPPPHFFFLKQGLSLKLEPTDRLDWQRNPRLLSVQPASPMSHDVEHAAPPSLLKNGCWGSRLFNPLSCFLCPQSAYSPEVLSDICVYDSGDVALKNGQDGALARMKN